MKVSAVGNLDPESDSDGLTSGIVGVQEYIVTVPSSRVSVFLMMRGGILA
jgi:hypothetical protein